MPGFDNWKTDKSDFLNDCIRKHNGGVRIDEWEYYRNPNENNDEADLPGSSQNKVMTGFSVKKNAHCVPNMHIGFSYPNQYHMKYDRFREVFDASFTFEMFLQLEARNGIGAFSGNCFGMSATAALGYEERFVMDGYVSDTLPLTKGGYDEILRTNYGPIAVLKTDSELTKAVERYQIWQYSGYYQGIRSRSILLSNQTIFQQIINGILQDRKTYIILVRWEITPGKNVGHAMAVDSSREPVNMGNGLYRVFLYDPNYPYYEFEGNDDPLIYKNAENRFIDMNIYDGSWKIYHLKVNNGSSSQQACVGQEPTGKQIHGGQFRFVETEDIPDSFEKRFRSAFNSEPNSGMGIIRYRSSNMSICNQNGERLYRCQDGIITDCKKEVLDDFPYLDYTENPFEPFSTEAFESKGQLSIRDGYYSVSIEEGYISYCNESIYAGVFSDGAVYVEFSEKPFLKLRAPLPTTVNVVLQNKESGFHNFITYSMDIKISCGVTTISINNNNLNIVSDVIQTIDLKVTTENETVDKNGLHLERELQITDKKRGTIVEW